MLDIDAIKSVLKFDELPLEYFQEAVNFSRDLISKDGKDALCTSLLLAGIWQGENGHESKMLLPWSPIHGVAVDLNNKDLAGEAQRWIWEKIAYAVLALDDVGRDLWKQKWPLRCVHLLTRGRSLNHVVS